ncbi:MAG: sigma-54 dependent transcriptional regulator [Acidiferrobacterales bacterium]|nr:sigma-54 dependent transcriptional regulator [Acidiferrobacterales bacterium]
MVNVKSHILVVDDELDIRDVIADILEDYGYHVTSVHDAAAASSAVRLNRFDAILLDIWLPGKDGITLLKEWTSRQDFNTPVVMMSAHGTVQTAVEAVQLGAFDYLEKPVSAGRLDITLRNAVRSGTAGSHRTVSATVDRGGLQLVGNSEVMQFLRKQIEIASSTVSNVLVVGEAGSGKRTIARMIHNASRGETAPCVDYDQLTSEAGEPTVSELVAKAENGTIVVSDIHTYDGHRQNKLLGVINALSGMSEQDSSAGIPRVVATVSDSIFAAVERGYFRREILNRMAGMTVNVPALKEYREDIPEVTGYFTDYLSRSENLPYKRFSTSALNCMRNHSWGGNLSELTSVLRQVLADGIAETVSDTDITPLLVERIVPQEQVMPDNGGEYYYSLSFRDARAQFERSYLLHNLKQFESYVELAKKTGLHRSSLFRKLKEHGIEVGPGYEGAQNNTDSSS